MLAVIYRRRTRAVIYRTRATTINTATYNFLATTFSEWRVEIVEYRRYFHFRYNIVLSSLCIYSIEQIFIYIYLVYIPRQWVLLVEFHFRCHQKSVSSVPNKTGFGWSMANSSKKRSLKNKCMVHLRPWNVSQLVIVANPSPSFRILPPLSSPVVRFTGDIHDKLMRSSRQICPLQGLIAAAQIELPPPPLYYPAPSRPPAPVPTPQKNSALPLPVVRLPGYTW